MDLNKLFVHSGIYRLKANKEDIFLCEMCHNRYIGKLTRYERIDNNLYKKTKLQYFLSDYKEGDLKELFVNRDNYDMLGMIGNNFIQNKEFIVKEN